MSNIDLTYTTQESGFDPKMRYENPRYFNGSITRSSGVLVIGDWPDVVAAYEAAGIPVQVGGEHETPDNAQINEANEQTEHDPYADMTDDELRALIKEKTGKSAGQKQTREQLVKWAVSINSDASQPAS